MNVQQAQQLVEAVFASGVRLVPPAATVLKRSIEIAAAYGQPHPYDALYAATAEALHCEFWTHDRTFQQAVTANLPHVRWLGERQGVV